MLPILTAVYHKVLFTLYTTPSGSIQVLINSAFDCVMAICFSFAYFCVSKTLCILNCLPKFYGRFFLLQVTKTVNAEVLSQEERRQLLNAISFKFITRLLKTGKF